MKQEKRIAGIYRLYWPESGHYYIGKAKDIYKRFASHLRTIKSVYGMSVRYRSMAAEIKGEPVLELLEECLIHELDIKERIHVTQQFDIKYCVNSVRYYYYSDKLPKIKLFFESLHLSKDEKKAVIQMLSNQVSE